MTLLSLLRRVYRNLPITRELLQINNRLEYVMEKLMAVEYLDKQNRQLLIDRYRRQLLDNHRYSNSKRLSHYEMQVFSQNGEDGIIAEIFNRIGVQSKTFIEIGVEDGSENNSVFLLFQGWNGCWIEADETAVEGIQRRFERPIAEGRLVVIRSFVTAENIGALLQQAQISGELDLLSLDIDRNTYWIWAALPRLKPRIVVVEYNGNIPPTADWKVEYDAKGSWHGGLYFGASLKAYELLGRQYGYCLVGCDLNGVNAFFVRHDLCEDKFEEPFTSEHHFEPLRLFLLQRSNHPPCFNEDA